MKLLQDLMLDWTIKPKKLLLGPALGSQTPEEFIEYVKSLYSAAASKSSKSVDGVTLTFGKRTIIRIKREPKLLTRDEVSRLAEEHEQDEPELLALFAKRKIGVSYADGDERQVVEASLFAKKESRTVKRRKKPESSALDSSASELSSETTAAVGE